VLSKTPPLLLALTAAKTASIHSHYHPESSFIYTNDKRSRRVLKITVELK